LSNFPRDQRESAFEIARRNYEDAMRHQGQNPDHGAAKEWLEMVMKGLRVLVSEIDASGGSAGGRA
jgi:hypothetical protein